MGASLREVARKAGVSTSTVSRYVKGELNVTVDTSRKIQDAMSEVGWSPRLKKDPSLNSIALLVPSLTNPFFASLADEIVVAAKFENKQISVHLTGGGLASEISTLKAVLKNDSIHGILYVGNNMLDEVIDVTSFNKPFVMVDEIVLSSESLNKVPYVVSGNLNGAYQATSHLIVNGHETIALVGGPVGLSSAEQRELGFRKAMKAHGLACSEDLVFRGPYSEAFGASILPALVNKKISVSAVFACSDIIAVGLIRAAKESNLDIPKDLSIIGFDNIPLCDWLSPRLTTVSQPVSEMATAALQALISQSHQRSFENAVLPMRLVTRASVEKINNQK